eukprot:345734_1
MLSFCQLIVGIFLLPKSKCDSLIVYTNATTFKIDKDFLSADLDASLWNHYENGYPLLESSSLKLYATYFQPSLLRFSGTSADALCYTMKQTDNKLSYTNNNNKGFNNCQKYMNQSEFDSLLHFANDTGFSDGIIFGLNALQRYDNGSWNSTNAEILLDYYYKNYYRKYDMNYEMGNEPDIWQEKYNYPNPNGTQ